MKKNKEKLHYKKTLLNHSFLLSLLHDKIGMVESGVIEKIEQDIYFNIDVAIHRAKRNDRNTLMLRDL